MKNFLHTILHSDKTGGVLLLLSTILSISIANTSLGPEYIAFWHTKFAGMSLEHWINDGLMTIFFLLIGLELEREIYEGELSSKKNAILPIFAAIGGMVVPAGIYFLLNINSQTISGAGIPMATDIAFALAILSLLGKRVPLALKIFLTALAVIDDLGAILIISIFYSSSISLLYLLLAAGVAAALLILRHLKTESLLPYLLGGALMWFFMLNSGIHATITGVILAFIIPFKSIKNASPSAKLLDVLHSPVTFIILPLFAIANTAISFNGGGIEALETPLSLGIIFGLILGKPIGILLFTYIPSVMGITKLPHALNYKHVLGAGLLGGIGFTMSIFITLLAFSDSLAVNAAKIAIMEASLIAGFSGYLILLFWGKHKKEHTA